MKIRTHMKKEEKKLSQNDANNNMNIVEFSLSQETKECALVTRMYRKENSIFAEVNNKHSFFITIEPGKLADVSKKLRTKAKEELSIHGIRKEEIEIIARHVSGEIMNNLDMLRDLESKDSQKKRKLSADDIWDEDGKLDLNKLTPQRIKHLHNSNVVLHTNKVTKTKINTSDLVLTNLKNLNNLTDDERYNFYKDIDKLRFKKRSRILYEAIVFRTSDVSENEISDDLTTKIADTPPTKDQTNNKKGDIFLEDADRYNTKFVYYDEDADEFKTVDYVIKDGKVILPTPTVGTPSVPYEFFDANHLNQFYRREVKDKVSESTLFDDFYKIYRHYNKQPQAIIISRAAATVTSYFADLFPYISYFGGIGLPGTSKSTDIETEGWITYRAMKMTNPSSAQIVRLFGNVEPGQYTLIVDEADNIDKDSDLMPMIKEGYRFGATAQKVNDFTRKLDYYYPYSMKFWAAEHAPEEWKTLGFYDRTFVNKTKKREQTSKDPNVKNLDLNVGLTGQDQYWKSFILDTRRKALLYRMVNYNKPLPDIDIGIGGRDKEVVYPYLQLFYDTRYQDYVVDAFQLLLDDMNNLKRNNISTVLCIKIGKFLYKNRTNMLRVIEFWDELKQDINFGTYMQDVSGKKRWIESPDYGEITQQKIAIEIRNNLPSVLKHKDSGNVWIINIDGIIERLRTYVYQSRKIKLKLNSPEGSEGSEASAESALDYLKMNYRKVDESKDRGDILNEKLGRLWSVIQELEKDNEDYYKNDNANPPNMTEKIQLYQCLKY